MTGKSGSSAQEAQLKAQGDLTLVLGEAAVERLLGPLKALRRSGPRRQCRPRGCGDPLGIPERTWPSLAS